LTAAPLLGASRLWYSLPLIITISLVYGATRHEHMPQILEHAVRFGIQTIGFLMLVIAIAAIVMTWLV
jgi:hypothetical protein